MLSQLKVKQTYPWRPDYSSQFAHVHTSGHQGRDVVVATGVDGGRARLLFAHEPT